MSFDYDPFDPDNYQLYEDRLSKIDNLMIALSPDGKNLASFEPRSMRLVTSPVDLLESFHQKLEKEDIQEDSSNDDVKINIVEIPDHVDDKKKSINFQKSFYNSRDYLNEKDIKKRIEFVSSLRGWSIAISNKFRSPKGDGYDNLIALSRIEKADVEDEIIENVKGFVIIFLVSSLNGLIDPKEGESIMIDFGGLVDFFVDDEHVLCIKNRSGIHRYVLKYDDDEKELVSKELEKLDFPERLINFNNKYKDHFWNYIKKMTTNNHLLVDTSQHKPVELYNLKTNQLVNIFYVPKEKFSLSNITFSISNNEKLLAYSQCNNIIYIYSIESGISLYKKIFDENVEIKVLHFFDNDERIFVLGLNISCIWNIFSSSNELINVEENINKNPYKFSKHLSFITKSNSDGIVAVLDKITKKPVITRLTNYIEHNEPDEIKLTRVVENFLPIDFTYSNVNTKTLRYPGRMLESTESRSYFLQNDPLVILSIGFNVVQVWRANINNAWVLEYIWTSEEKLDVKSLDIGLRKFSLILTRPKKHRKGKKGKGKEKSLNLKSIKIEIPDQKGMVTVVKHACQSLEYLHKQKPLFSHDDFLMESYDDIINQTRRIIYEFIKANPEKWIFMDIRYNVMANIIRSRSYNLVYLILFNGDKKIDGDDLNTDGFNHERLPLHRPQITRWPKPKNDEIYIEESDLEVALQCYEENIQSKTDHDMLIFTYLWEYYFTHATHDIGWMISVTKVLPRLFDLGLDHIYIEELFYKSCYKLKKSNLPFTHFKKLHPSDNMLCVALPLTELPSESTSDYEQLSKNELYQVNILPVTYFTVNTSHHDLNIFKKFMYTLLPRNYLNSQKKNNSTLIRLISKRDFDPSFFENPIMEVALKWMWSSAKKHYYVVFMLYVLHLITFSIVSYAYAVHLDVAGTYNRVLFLMVIIISYYTSLYFFVTEVKKLNHYGFKKYFRNLFNWFDLTSAFLPLIVLSIIVKDSYSISHGFKNVVSSRYIIVSFSFILLLLWIELILLLRLFLVPSHYIYILLNIIKKTWPALFFLFTIIIAFAHSLFILLGFASSINLKESASTYKFSDSNVSITEVPENPFSDPITLATSSFDWNDLPFDEFDFIPSKIISSCGSIFIVFMMQNMIIALMNGAYEKAESNAKLGVLKFRSELIHDFESLEKSPWISPPKQPQYFCFIDDFNTLEKWKKFSDKRKKNKILSLMTESVTIPSIPDNLDDLKPLWTWNDNDDDDSRRC